MTAPADPTPRTAAPQDRAHDELVAWAQHEAEDLRDLLEGRRAPRVPPEVYFTPADQLLHARDAAGDAEPPGLLDDLVDDDAGREGA